MSSEAQVGSGQRLKTFICHLFSSIGLYLLLKAVTLCPHSMCVLCVVFECMSVRQLSFSKKMFGSGIVSHSPGLPLMNWLHVENNRGIVGSIITWSKASFSSTFITNFYCLITILKGNGGCHRGRSSIPFWKK